MWEQGCFLMVRFNGQAMSKSQSNYGTAPASGWLPIVCELYVQDIQQSLTFWRDILGFTIAYQRPEEHFAYLEHAHGAQVMLYQHPNGGTSASNSQQPPRFVMQLFVSSLEPVLTAIQDTNWPLVSGPVVVWRRWGDRMGGKREIRIEDPDGFMVLIAEPAGE
jgi:catechol 2,3-dioxygenase-like lactoylglutathione lyase family enzyme